MGRSTMSEVKRLRVYAKYLGKCAHCSEETIPFFKGHNKRNAVIDHIIPISRGGGNSDDNLQLLCSLCNSKKGAKTMEEFIIHVNKDKDTEAMLDEMLKRLPELSHPISKYKKYLPKDDRYGFIKPVYDYILQLENKED